LLCSGAKLRPAIRLFIYPNREANIFIADAGDVGFMLTNSYPQVIKPMQKVQGFNDF